MKQLRRGMHWAFGGGLAGFLWGLFPPFGGWSEIRNFQIFLLETAYELLSPHVSARLMQGLGTSAGELLILTAWGIFLGAVTGLFADRLLSRRFPGGGFSPWVAVWLSTFTSFAILFGISWCRIALIHSNKRMFTLDGFFILSAGAGMGLGTGVLIFSLLQGLKRFRLEKGTLGAVTVFFFAHYLWFPFAEISKTEAAPAPLHGVRSVILLGGDGATWDVMLPLIREGRLPHFKKLMAEGAWGGIRTTFPWKSPILWASIATGKRARSHGIGDFVVREAETQKMYPVSIASRKTKAIWDITSEKGLRNVVVNWYGGWPAEPLNGVMVSSRSMISTLSDRIFPRERTEEMDSWIQEFEQKGIGRDEKMVAEIGLRLLDQERPNVGLLYLRDIDHMQHFYWRYYAALQGSPLARWFYAPTDAAEAREKGSKLKAAYEELDRVLGEILRRKSPDTAVMVVSDHGGGIKSPYRLYFDLNPVLEALGFLQREEGEGKKAGAAWGRTCVFDSTERPWYEERKLFVKVPRFARSPAPDTPGKSGASSAVNRHPEGPFGEKARAEDEEKLLTSLIVPLQSIRTEAGKPLVRKSKLKRSQTGPPYLAVWLNVKLKEKETLHVGGWEIPVSKVVWNTALTGNHRASGIILLAGPGIRPGYRLRSASILDVTPTLLYLLDLPVGDDMEGRVLLEVFDSTWRGAHPLQRISTYETGERHAPVKVLKSDADEELLDQLRSLGYIQ